MPRRARRSEKASGQKNQKKERKPVPLFAVARLKNIVLPKSRRGRVYKIWNLQRNTHFKVFQGQNASELAMALVQAWEKIKGKG